MLLGADMCQNTVKGWRVVGHIVLIVKVLVPILIIVTSFIPMFNALVKGNADETVKSWKTVGRKIAAGVIIFLIPSLVESSVKLFAGKEIENEDVMICVHCFSSPNEDDCLKAVRDFDTMEKEEIDKEKSGENGKIDDSKIDGGSVDTDKMGTASTEDDEN